MTNIETKNHNDIFNNMKRRRSMSKLVAPAPSQTELEQAIAHALTAPDHRQLTPWQFHSITGTDLDSFGEVLVQASKDSGITDVDKLAKVAHHPKRAPMIIVCVTKVVEHLKVPAFEQLLATGAAIQNMLLTFEAMGYGTMWRSGDVIHTQSLKKAFNATDNDYIAGIIYVGTKETVAQQKPLRTVADFLQPWSVGKF